MPVCMNTARCHVACLCKFDLYTCDLLYTFQIKIQYRPLTFLSRYALYAFLVMDGFGNGRLVYATLVQNEKAETLQAMVDSFKCANPHWQSIKTIIIDKDFTEIKVLRERFPDARVLLCTFHVVKAMRLRISGIEGLCLESKQQLLSAAKKLINTTSEKHFEETLQEIEVSNKDFHQYLVASWIPMKDMWAMHIRQNCLTYGNNSNNRIESFNQKIKQITNSSDKLASCIEKVLAFNHTSEQQLLFNVFRNDCTTTSTKGLNAVRCSVIDLCTEFAANKCLHQLDIAKKACYIVKEESSNFLVISASGEQQVVNKMLTECTCSFRKTYDLPCRHVLFLLKA